MKPTKRAGRKSSSRKSAISSADKLIELLGGANPVDVIEKNAFDEVHQIMSPVGRRPGEITESKIVEARKKAKGLIKRLNKMLRLVKDENQKHWLAAGLMEAMGQRHIKQATMAVAADKLADSVKAIITKVEAEFAIRFRDAEDVLLEDTPLSMIKTLTSISEDRRWRAIQTRVPPISMSPYSSAYAEKLWKASREGQVEAYEKSFAGQVQEQVREIRNYVLEEASIGFRKTTALGPYMFAPRRSFGLPPADLQPRFFDAVVAELIKHGMILVDSNGRVPPEITRHINLFVQLVKD